jgi:anti-sigma B factor antagonist
VHAVSIEHHDDIAIVLASGELDAFAAPDLAAALTAVSGRQVVVDLSRVAFMDSTALGEIVRAARVQDELGSVLRVVLPEGPARRIFEITGLDRALPIDRTRVDAVRELET